MMNPPSTEELPVVEVDKENQGPTLRPFTFYANHLRAKLPRHLFEPYPLRMVWFFGYALLAIGALGGIAFLEVSWPIKLLLSVGLGFAYGGLGFFAHELLHGSVVRSRSLQDFLGLFCFMPFFISPTFWRYWHNQLHHAKTQSVIADPDAFPNLRIFHNSKFMQFMYPFTPGSGHRRSYLYFFFWFSFHCLVAQTYLRFRNAIYDKMNHRRVTWELTGQVVIMVGIWIAVGPSQLLWTALIPLFVQNYYVMSYIATNHNLNPLTRVNDPLANSLTVTSVPLFETIQLNFGYHVEHHIFPSMNAVHAKKVHALLKQEFPFEFKVMRKSQAMRALYRTSRIYKDSRTLINPETGQTFATLSQTPPSNA